LAPRKKGDRVTIKTVAEDAGVSVAAVSKVLRDAYGVSDELRSKVQASMLKLSYRPHAAARGMRGQTYTLGVLFPDLRNPFFGDIMAGVNSALERTQYQPMLGISESQTVIEIALAEAMIDRQMDGLILVGPRLTTRDLVGIADRIPTVLIGHYPPPGLNVDTVNNDDELGAHIVVKHLYEMGYRRIAYLNQILVDEENALVTTKREIGFLAAVKEIGIARQAQVLRSLQTPRETQAAVRRALQSRNPPEAIFCWTDFIALEVLSMIHELGLKVPQDVAVVGYDNTSYCDLAQNSLTSIDQSGQVLGLQAARLLIERIKGRETPESLVITPRLVVRQSSGPKRA